MKKMLGAALVALMAAGSANATLLTFTVTGSYSIAWQIDSEPTPSASGNGVAFVIFDVALERTALGIADFYFYNDAKGGGFEIYDYYSDNYLVLTNGPQLYTGPEAAPVFKLGTFDIADSGGAGKYSLNIAETVNAAVPEPATWAMFIGGFGVMGSAMRRRQRVNVSFA
jgi:hypothetical protein